MARVRFLGGTATVTGSKFLVESGSGAVLIDCGMFQGRRAVRKQNWDDAFSGVGLPDEVLITHAHLDHTGFLPRLVGHWGYAGPIRATAATADLLGIMLRDAAHIQEEQAAYANRKGYSKHEPALPLYTGADAEATLRLVRSVPYHDWVPTPVGDARFTFAGHILGSAHVCLETDSGRVVFSGDVGRWDIPVLKDPEPPPAADLVVMESTYGDRVHAGDGQDPTEMLAAAIGRIIDRGGVMVIPAFALGRTQELLFRLRELEDVGRIPELPIFLDSPMAIDATELYRTHHEEHDLETEALDRAGVGPLRPARLRMTRRVDESIELNGLEGPAVIISASGMATAGRVQHHLKRLLPHSKNLVAFVGYQAAGTPGRALIEGASRIRIHGKYVPVRAEVTRLEAFSAHADSRELIRWLREGAGLPKRVALVHGESRSREALAALLRSELGIEVLLPRKGGTIDV